MKTKTLTKKLNQVLTLLLTIVALMVGQSAWAQEPTSGNCGKTGNDNVTWEVTDEDNNGTYETITINGTGAMADYDSNSQPWVAFKENITTAVIGEGVTSIGGFAFGAYTNLTSVTFAEGSHLESIGYSAFNYCTSLTAITIPENVTSIGGFAFGSCYNLTKFTLLGSKVIFGANVFALTGDIYIYATIDILDSYYLQFPELGISPDRLVGMLTAKEGEPGEYWTSLWSGAYNYKVPSDTKIYKAAVSGTKLVLTELTKDKFVGMGESVILKTTSPAILLPGYVGGSTNDFSGNQLTAGNIELMNPDNVYVLDVKEGTGVGLYRLSANEIDSAPEVYLEYSGSPACEVFPIPFSFTNLQAKLTASSTDADAPTVITLDRDVVAESGDERLLITYNHHVIIDLNGHAIDRHLSAATGDGHVINVRNNASLVIRDSQGGGQITGGYTFTTGGGITVSGTLTLEGGTICGNRSQNNGGGLSVSGTFIMTGGTITNNTCTGNYGKGSAIYASQGTARLQGGTITGNYGKNAIYTDRNMTVSGTYDVSGNFIKAVEVNPNVAPDIVLFGSVINIAAAISPAHPAIVTFETSSQTVVTSGWSTHMGNTLADDYFTPSSNDRVNFIYNNEVVFATTAQKEEMLSELYAITLPDDITTASPAAIVSNKHYYAAGSTVTLDYTGAAPAEGYIRAIYVNDVLATDNGDGTYTATMPAEDATVTIGQIAIPWSGSGDSANDPYLIQYPSQLDLLATRINAGGGTAYYYKFFKLANDIAYDGTENNYTPIGNNSGKYSFSGTFDGDGHIVSGININRDDNYQGLFGYVNGTVKNVTLANSTITGHNNVGGIAGYNGYTVRNCRVENTVTIGTYTNGADNHGGIVGYCNYGTVDGCISSATVSPDGNTSRKYSGIVGYNNKSTIRNCLAIGATVSSESEIGAIVGLNDHGTLANNYYYNCTVNGATENIGTGTSGDISDNDGAVKVSSVLSDTETVPTDLDGKVVFRREFTGGKASTVIFPFAHEKGTEGSYYTFGGVAYDDVEGKWKATMNEVSGTTLAANTPYLFMPAGSEAHTPVLFHGIASYNTAGTTDNGDWSFVGVYERKTWAAADCGNDYGFAATSGKATDGVTDVEAGDFVKLAEGAWIRPMRSYLTYTGSGNPFAAPKHRAGAELPSSISVILVNSDGTTTEIETTNFTNYTNSDAWFTLDGRKLSGKPTKAGLYIHGNRKVVIK